MNGPGEDQQDADAEDHRHLLGRRLDSNIHSLIFCPFKVPPELFNALKSHHGPMLNNYQMHHYIHVTMYSVHCTQKCWALWTTSCIMNLYQILNKTMIMLEIWKKKMFLLWLPTFCSATTSVRSLDFVVFALTSNASTRFHFPNLLWSKDDPTFCLLTYKIILTTCSMEIVHSVGKFLTILDLKCRKVI